MLMNSLGVQEKFRRLQNSVFRMDAGLSNGPMEKNDETKMTSGKFPDVFLWIKKLA